VFSFPLTGKQVLVGNLPTSERAPALPQNLGKNVVVCAAAREYPLLHHMISDPWLEPNQKTRSTTFGRILKV